MFRCRTWPARARELNQQPRWGIWECDRQPVLGWLSWDVPTLDPSSKTNSNQHAQRKKSFVTGNPTPPQKILSFGKSGSKHIFWEPLLLSWKIAGGCPPTLLMGCSELSGETQLVDRSHQNNCNSILGPVITPVLKAICHKPVICIGAINRQHGLVLGTLLNFTAWVLHRAYTEGTFPQHSWFRALGENRQFQLPFSSGYKCKDQKTFILSTSLTWNHSECFHQLSQVCWRFWLFFLQHVWSTGIISKDLSCTVFCQIQWIPQRWALTLIRHSKTVPQLK